MYLIIYVFYVEHDNLLKVLMIWCIKFENVIVYAKR